MENGELRWMKKRKMENGGKLRNIRRWRRKGEDEDYERRTKDI
jgi:hypothetical protein